MTDEPKPPTPRELDCLVAIDTISQGGQPPSLRQLRDAMGLRSLTTVLVHLDHLSKKGMATREPNVERSIRLTETGLQYARSAASC